MSETQHDPRQVAARIGKVGVWTFALDRLPMAREREVVSEIEELGYPALWIPEGLYSKEALSHSALLLAAGRKITIATGIASIWARDAVSMSNGAQMLADAFPDRFLLTIGVSHQTSVDRRGAFKYQNPYSHMREYLDGMDGARYPAKGVPPVPPLLLAALGPKMLRLAAERATGAHPYFVPVEHTALARKTMGPAPLIATELAVVLESDPEVARKLARDYMIHYLRLENYANNLMRLGWSAQDIAEGGSDALVDAIVGWGDVDAIAKRVKAHLDAGADHVCIQPISADPKDVGLTQLKELAPTLLGI